MMPMLSEAYRGTSIDGDKAALKEKTELRLNLTGVRRF
jgi:hypothetical protein